MSETIIPDHPFFDDYVKVFQSACLKELGAEGRQRLKEVVCALFPSSILEERWPGWEIGIPRPAKLLTKEVLHEWQTDVALFLEDFFKRVEKGMLYCDYSTVIEKFGKERVERRMRAKSGLHYNLEAAYWTFNVKFTKWHWQNIQDYGCSLVCGLDEVLARFDSYLRQAFFPTPGPGDIGWGKERKKFQKRMLGDFAAHLEKPLIKQIWG